MENQYENGTREARDFHSVFFFTSVAIIQRRSVDLRHLKVAPLT